MKQKYAQGEVPVPGPWRGYRIEPSGTVFWQGGAGRLHDCFRYSRDDTGEWMCQRIAP